MSKQLRDLNKSEFIELMRTYEEKGKVYSNIKINQPYDISPKEFNDLEKFTVTFDFFDKFYVLRHRSTNEIFLGDLNLGGHGARCRIIKVNRDDFFMKSDELLKWYENRSSKIWEK